MRSVKDFPAVTRSQRGSANGIVPQYSHLWTIIYLFCVSPSGKKSSCQEQQQQKRRKYIISKNCQRVLMFHLWLVKCMIKLFFLSSFLFFLASLITENYKLAVNILTFLNDSIYCIWFLCQAHRCITSSGADFSHQNSSSPTLYILKYAQGRKYKV